MDYSRYGMKCYARKLKSPLKKLKSKFWIVVFRLLIIGIVGVAICLITAGFGAVNALIDTVPQIKLDDLKPMGYSSTSYYSDGTVAQVFAGAQANRVLVSIDEIPVKVQHAFVALEDVRFYEHSGIDIKGIMRAGFSVVKVGDLSYGASTITQQLLKNNVFSGWTDETFIESVKRKIRFIPIEDVDKL